MFKGHARIELRDAKTGKITDVVESDNMVTNAVQNILSSGVEYGMEVRLNDAYAVQWNTNSKVSLDYITSSRKDGQTNGSIAETLFGGVLVFNKNVELDEDHIIPTQDDILHCIGHAGQDSKIVGDNYGGSYNLTESLVSSDFSRFVWDFDTSACNGEIKSICLTSARGGKVGLQSVGAEIPKYTFTVPRDYYWLSSQLMGSNSPIWFAFSLDEVTISNATNLFLTDDKFGLLSAEQNKIVYANIPDEFKTIDNGYKLDNALSAKGGSLSSVILDIEHVDWGVTFKRLDYSSEILITADQYATGNRSQFLGGVATIYKYDFDGNRTVFEIDCANMYSALTTKLIDETGIEFTKNFNLKLFDFRGVIYIVYTYYSQGLNFFGIIRLFSNGTFNLSPVYSRDDYKDIMQFSGSFEPQLLNFNNELYFCPMGYNSPVFPVNSKNLSINFVQTLFLAGGLMNVPTLLQHKYAKAPFMTDGIISNRASCYDLYMFAPYLATINNISGNLVKTADKTMKIVYTLRQV